MDIYIGRSPLPYPGLGNLVKAETNKIKTQEQKDGKECCAMPFTHGVSIAYDDIEAVVTDTSLSRLKFHHG